LKAAVLFAPNRIDLKTIDDPVAGPGDILVRVSAATICGTDIRIFRGQKTAGVRYPSVLGHEFAGEIIEAGGHACFEVGDRVGVCPFISCGHCRLCKTDMENLCTNGTAVGYEIDGAFAEFIRIPARAVEAGNVRKLPDRMSFEVAALIEPLSCVLNGQNKVATASGDTVLVMGAGPIGQMHIRLARLRGVACIIVSEPDARRRAVALRSGADTAIDPASEDVRERVMDETGGRGADVVIIAIGIPALARQSTELTAHGGRISLFAGFSRGETADMDINAIHYQELTVTGAFGLSRRDYDRSFDIIASGQIQLSDMITHRFALDDVKQAFAVAESGEAIKVVIGQTPGVGSPQSLT